MKYLEPESLSESMAMLEQLSALHDGQLDTAQAAALVKASLADDSLMLQWRSMSAISNVLREQQGGFAVQRSTVAEAALPAAPHQDAANDGIFRWKMIAGVAALAAVGSLVWGLLGATGDKAGLPQGGVLAQNQSTPTPAAPAAGQGLVAIGGQQSVLIAGQEVTMIRDPRLDEFLAAHKQFGGVSALQQPAGSLRSVSLATQRP